MLTFGIQQELILSFAVIGTPGASGTTFSPYGDSGAVLEPSSFGITTESDTTSKARCAWWQVAPYAISKGS